MNLDDLNRDVSLACPLCGMFDFSQDDTAGLLTCTGCEHAFTRDDLIAANADRIQGAQEEMVSEAAGAMMDELQKKLKQALRGSKHIRLR